MTTAAATPEVPAPPAAPSPVDGVPTITDEISSDPVDVVVLLKDQPTSLSMAEESVRLGSQQALIDSWAQQHGLESDRQFGYLVNGFSASVPGDRLSALSLEPEVLSVRRERVYERTEHTARDLQGVPAAFADHGVDGTGMVISIIDSGIDPSHPALRLDDCDEAAIQEITPAAEAGFTCKVPSGYNYADESYVIKDGVVDAHGQHVGGIAAANGSAGDVPGDFVETGELDGAAPNAQLLAMKVFSNSGGGATDSDIVAAIEDSVKLDADVINMSLGAANGQKNSSDASSLAIESARDAGVVTVIAAGNDGQNFSPAAVADDLYGLHDDGTVGSPGTLGSALTVASIDNAVLTQLMAYVDDETEGVPYSPATGTFDGQAHRLVDLGLGTLEDTDGVDLDGDYALIARGEISFEEKYQNAITAGAGGVVVHNTDDAPFGMAGVESFTLPGITVTSSVGRELKAAVEAGETTIRITDEVDVRPSASGLTPSSFTSWGATPTLDFEPEIAGIGGNVYSTYNDGTYGMSSGTSMASPNVAGVTALVLQHLEQTRPEVTGAERVDLAKVLLMNTALVPTDEAGVPYSPRQIGAGLAQADKALDSQVIATVDGRGAAALREMSGPTSFTVTLTNSGDTDADFTIPAAQLLAETNEAGAATAVRPSDGSVAAPGSVTVPAGGSADVEVTVAPETGTDHFTAGWVGFDSADDAQPDLGVPFLGFVGDWNAEPIILPAGEPLEGVGIETGLLTYLGGQALPLESDDFGRFWLSPNEDGDMDAVVANLVVMRNASDIRYEILTEDGTPLTILGEEQGLYRSLLSDYGAVPDPSQLQWLGYSFDGTVYDPKVVDYAALPDGDYTYRVSTRLSEEHPWQQVDMPFGVDATAPQIEFGEFNDGLLTFTVTEEGSGLFSIPQAQDAAGNELEVIEQDGTYALQVDSAEVPFVTVSAVDRGFTLGTATKVFGEAGLLIAGASEMHENVIGPEFPLVSEGELTLQGYASADVVEVRAGERTAAVAGGRFALQVPLREGLQELTVEGVDAAGEAVTSQLISVTYDATAPELTIDRMETDAEGRAVLAEDGSITVAGTVSDEREGAVLGVSSGQESAEVAEDGSFEITVTPGDSAAAFTLNASDGVNTTSQSFAISGRAQAPTWAMPEVSNAECTLESAVCFVPGAATDVSEDGSIFTLRGEYPAGGTITLTPGSRVGEDGEHLAADPITAQLTQDGTFAADLSVSTGENHFRMVVTDADGEVRYDRGIRLYFDVTAPTLQIDEPVLVGGTLYTNTEHVAVAGAASDDGWGYGLSLNGSTVLERFDIGSPGEESNRRDFSTDISVADGDTLLVEFYDSNGNMMLGLIPVVLDEAVPTIEIANLADGEVVDDGRELEVTAADDNLAGLQVLLDGEVVHDEVTELATTEHSLEDALIDLRELQTARAEEHGGEGSNEITTFGASTRAMETSLTAMVPTAELEEGRHTVTILATDLAGNTVTQEATFRVAAAQAEIRLSGPAEIALDIHREELGDQAALAAAVLAQYEVTVDGETSGAAEAGLGTRLAPGTVLVEGEQQVTVLVVDEAGDVLMDATGTPTELTVTVTVALEQVTLTAGEVRATATFRSDDTLTASIEKADGEEGRLLVLANAFASLPSEITVPGSEGQRIFLLQGNGTRLPVSATWADGVLTFSGPSQGSYLIVAAETSAGNGGGGGGAGGGSGGGESGSGGDGSTAGDSRGPLARTGAEVLVPLAAAVVLLLGGGALLVIRRRRG